jgi:hypothetical protein
MSERKDRLNALKDAVNEWADAETERLENERDFLQSVLEGRTNSGQLSDHIQERASVLTEEEVNAYLAE